MLKDKFNTDYIFLGLLGVLICNTLYQNAVNNVTLNLNNYLAFTAWSIGLLLLLINSVPGKYAVSVLLVAGLFEVFNFMPSRTNISIGIGDISKPTTNGIGFSPIVFLLCVGYYFMNRKTIHQFFKRRLNDNDEQRVKKQSNMIDFYYKRFSGCSADEFTAILKNYNDYPREAKIAINRIKESKD